MNILPYVCAFCVAFGAMSAETQLHTQAAHTMIGEPSGNTTPLAKKMYRKKRSHSYWQKKLSETRPIKHQEFHPVCPLQSIGPGGNSIIMADDSIWEVSAKHRSIVSRWTEGSLLIIKLNTSWFASTVYRIKNTSTGEVVDVKLFQGPSAHYALNIRYIQWDSGEFVLSNGSVWQSPELSKKSQLSQPTWACRQEVLVGENDATSGGRYIIINIKNGIYITANRK